MERRHTDEQHLPSREDRAWVNQAVVSDLGLQRVCIDADVGERLSGVAVGTVEALGVFERDQVGGEGEDVSLDDLEGEVPVLSRCTVQILNACHLWPTVELVDKARDCALELFVVGHVEPEAGPQRKWQPDRLAGHDQQTPLGLFQAELLGKDGLKLAEIALEVGRRHDRKDIAALLHGESRRGTSVAPNGMESTFQTLNPSARRRGSSVSRTQDRSGSCCR